MNMVLAFCWECEYEQPVLLLLLLLPLLLPVLLLV